jgi:hypothetical protein
VCLDAAGMSHLAHAPRRVIYKHPVRPPNPPRTRRLAGLGYELLQPLWRPVVDAVGAQDVELLEVEVRLDRAQRLDLGWVGSVGWERGEPGRWGCCQANVVVGSRLIGPGRSSRPPTHTWQPTPMNSSRFTSGARASTVARTWGWVDFGWSVGWLVAWGRLVGWFRLLYTRGSQPNQLTKRRRPPPTSRFGDSDGLTPLAARMSSAVRATTGRGFILGGGRLGAISSDGVWMLKGGKKELLDRRASVNFQISHLSSGSLCTHTTASTLALLSISRAMPGIVGKAVF